MYDPTLRNEFPIQIVAAPSGLFTKVNNEYLPIVSIALLNNGKINYCVNTSDYEIKPISNSVVYKLSRLTGKYKQLTGGVAE
ncbi:hypothetical protein I7830_10780 [Mammaliicoccus sciuri]|uniref:hypothetical protein n=1 Tax=Mammaliicoccus TaxID=2803850 RepID=UPI00115A1B34|nr:MULTISPECIES: hypothetical protein [Mammaliicoccus]QPW14147.1 hypothetical protein I7830_10780 [Mammaliicoccus sciuri]